MLETQVDQHYLYTPVTVCFPKKITQRMLTVELLCSLWQFSQLSQVYLGEKCDFSLHF